MSEGLTIIQDAGMLAERDMAVLSALAGELHQNWQTAQVFRTQTEMIVSVLNDIKHPTPDSKYWQAVRVFPFSKTRHGLYLDVVKNTFAGVQLHGEAQIWHLCL